VTAVIRIVGYAWLMMTVTPIAVGYAIVWILGGTTSGGILRSIGIAALPAPGLVLVALAAWLDRRHRRWSAK
jgi:hypothetical protein